MMLISGTSRRYYRGISVNGQGIAGPEDIYLYKREDFIRDPKPVSLILLPGITGLKEGFLDRFITLKELILPDTVSLIGVSEAARDLFRNNEPTVRGRFGGFAEEFARSYGLGFMHRDLVLAETGDPDSLRGKDVMTLCFSPEGKPYIDLENFCRGSSGSNMGGGSESLDLPEDFYNTMSPEDIAALGPGNCYDSIAENRELTEFLLGAMERNGFFLKNKEPQKPFAAPFDK